MQKDRTVRNGLIITAVGILLIGVLWFLLLSSSSQSVLQLTPIPIELSENIDDYTIFEIDPEQSSVSFTLDEILRGLPTTVNGRSQHLSGQIALNLTDPTASQVGIIQINAQTLQTGNEFRDNAIHTFILESEKFERIVFEPRKISGLPKQFSLNEPATFQIEGDLTIRDITQSVAFTTTATVTNPSTLIGSATAQIDRTAFNLQIPDVPNVANVNNHVTLMIEFVGAAIVE